MELLVRAAGESSWRGRRGGTAGTGSRRKQLAGRRGGAAGTGSQRKQLAEALRRDGAKRKSVRKNCRSAGDDATASRKILPLRGRRCGCIVEELAAGRATPLRQREGAEQHREEAEQHREEAKWQQSALYSIFIPVPQAPYRHSYHNKIQKGRVILRYRE